LALKNQIANYFNRTGYPSRFFYFLQMAVDTTNTAQLLNGGNGLYTSQGLGKKMPYKVVKAGSKFQVFKLGDDNKPTGKALGTHPDMAKATAQMKALYASEKKAVKKEVTTYVTTSDNAANVTITADDSADNKELITKDWYEDEYPVKMAVPYVYGATTFADLMAQREAQEMAQELGDLTNDFGTLAYNISCSPEITDKAAALSALAKEYQDMIDMHVSHEMGEKELSIVKQIAGDNQPNKTQDEVEMKEESSDLVIWKENGTYRWLAAYSNNRRDDEAEIITTESHKDFEKALDNKEWPMPLVYLWHIPYPVGQADYHAYDESTGFPVAAGHFYKECDWAAEGILKEKWDGVSHGMLDRWVKFDPTNESLVVQHRTKEITFLPHWAAANKLSFSIISKEQSMSEIEKGLPAHKRPEFVKAFGEERVKQIEETLSAKSKEADEAGIDKKEVDTSQERVLTKEDLLTGLEFVLTQVKEVVDKLDTRLEALEKSVVKEADQFDILAQLKAKSIINASSAALVDGRSKLAKDAPIETHDKEAKGPTPVGLLNNLFAANEAWYTKGGGR
jgi:hypothetical protein